MLPKTFKSRMGHTHTQIQAQTNRDKLNYLMTIKTNLDFLLGTYFYADVRFGWVWALMFSVCVVSIGNTNPFLFLIPVVNDRRRVFFRSLWEKSPYERPDPTTLLRGLHISSAWPIGKRSSTTRSPIHSTTNDKAKSQVGKLARGACRARGVKKVASTYHLIPQRLGRTV